MTTPHRHLVVSRPRALAGPIFMLPIAALSRWDTLSPRPILPSRHAPSCRPLLPRPVEPSRHCSAILLHHITTPPCLGPVPMTPLAAALSSRSITPSHPGDLTLKPLSFHPTRSRRCAAPLTFLASIIGLVLHPSV